MLGVDFAYGRPTATQLKAAGVGFVGRYLSVPGYSKNLDKTEVLLYRASGIGIVTVFEVGAQRALAGRTAGITDARAAQAQLALLGAGTVPVYFAVDFDATPAQQPAINAYIAGAASVTGAAHTGVYGGFYVVQRTLNAGVCKYTWQTAAWSGGQWEPRAHIRQTGGLKLGDVACDRDQAMFVDFGQWSPPVPRPPSPTPIVFPKDDTFWTWLRWRTGTGEFIPYGPRNPLVRPNVPQHIPALWWKALSAFIKNQPK